MRTVARNTTLVRRVATACLALPISLSSQGMRSTPEMLLPAPWGTVADSVVRLAVNAGWEFVKVDADSDYVFRTVIHGQAAVVFASFGRNGLSRLEAAFAPQPTNEYLYRELTDSLVAQYGPAVVTTTVDGALRPARGMLAAIAWEGVLMGWRRDGWISLIFTCPESSPRLPVPRGRVAFIRTAHPGLQP